MEYKKNCQHNWIEKDNRIICTLCNKSTLKKISIDDDLSYGIKKNGQKYTIRKDRLRYFYPNEWNKFYNSLLDRHKLLFQFLICTGARIDEALHFKKTDLIDDKRKTIRLIVTKRKAKKPGEEEGKRRSFEINSTLYNKLKNENSLYIFLKLNDNMPLIESKKITTIKAITIRQLMKRHLKKVGIKDWFNFGLHNVRKTHGMWLKAHGIELSEICARLGHDANTYIKHYGSPSLFDKKDLSEMPKIIGNIYRI